MAPSDAEKMNRITRAMRLVCREFGWAGMWGGFVAPFISKPENVEKMCRLYDEVEAIVTEGLSVGDRRGVASLSSLCGAAPSHPRDAAAGRGDLNWRN